MQTALFLCLPRRRLIRERHPVNPARLAELNHQRALVREQLAWLEREIAKESAGFAPPNVVQPAVMITAPAAVQSHQVLPEQPSAVAVEAEAYRPDPVSTASDTRRGCFVALAVITLLIVGALTAIYIWRYSDRPLLFAGEKDAGASESTSASPSTSASKK
jgi:hypothetical protein